MSGKTRIVWGEEGLDCMMTDLIMDIQSLAYLISIPSFEHLFSVMLSI